VEASYQLILLGSGARGAPGFDFVIGGPCDRTLANPTIPVAFVPMREDALQTSTSANLAAVDLVSIRRKETVHFA
jgi:hypothetical protein